MHETQPSSSSLSAMQVLAERIAAETPHLRVLDVFESPCPFIKVKDTVHSIVVGFSSEADYITYLHITARGGRRA